MAAAAQYLRFGSHCRAAGDELLGHRDHADRPGLGRAGGTRQFQAADRRGVGRAAGRTRRAGLEAVHRRADCGGRRPSWRRAISSTSRSEHRASGVTALAGDGDAAARRGRRGIDRAGAGAARAFTAAGAAVRRPRRPGPRRGPRGRSGSARGVLGPRSKADADARRMIGRDSRPVRRDLRGGERRGRRPESEPGNRAGGSTIGAGASTMAAGRRRASGTASPTGPAPLGRARDFDGCRGRARAVAGAGAGPRAPARAWPRAVPAGLRAGRPGRRAGARTSVGRRGSGAGAAARPARALGSAGAVSSGVEPVRKIGSAGGGAGLSAGGASARPAVSRGPGASFAIGLRRPGRRLCRGVGPARGGVSTAGAPAERAGRAQGAPPARSSRPRPAGSSRTEVDARRTPRGAGPGTDARDDGSRTLPPETDGRASAVVADAWPSRARSRPASELLQFLVREPDRAASASLR